MEKKTKLKTKSKIKSKIKSNKIMLILLSIIVIGVILIFYGLIRYFYLGNGNNKYGNRTNDIEKYEISKKDKEKVVDLYDDISSVGKVEIDIKGKIIYITIDFVENIKLDDAKGLAVKSLEGFSDKVKSYYDMQFILTGNSLEEEGNLFPIMGSKNKNNSQIIWIKS